MTDLQIGLLAIGALVIGGVLLYNHVQERRAREAARRAFPGMHADALMGAASPAEGGAGGALRPGGPREAPEPEAEPDERLDYVIELRPRAPAPAAAVREHWRPIQRRHWPRALLAGPDAAGVWRAGLQLASRAGAAGEAELVEFRAAVETMAAALGAAVSVPEMRAALARARELDALCAATDIQVVMHVVAPAGAGLSGAVLTEAAEGAGLALEADGRFVQRSTAGKVALSISPRGGDGFDAASLRQSAAAISLALELPHAADTRRAFEAMARLARQLAAASGGAVVDDHGSPLGEPALAAIAVRLDEVRAMLEAKGFPPGGALAARLFS